MLAPPQTGPAVALLTGRTKATCITSQHLRRDEAQRRRQTARTPLLKGILPSAPLAEPGRQVGTVIQAPMCGGPGREEQKMRSLTAQKTHTCEITAETSKLPV